MLRTFIVVLALAVFAVPVPAGAALAQNQLSSDQILKLKSRVDAQRDAYLRFEMAEKDALADGSPDRAELYRQAKEKALTQHAELAAQLQKAQLARQEYEKRMDAGRAPDR